MDNKTREDEVDSESEGNDTRHKLETNIDTNGTADKSNQIKSRFIYCWNNVQ